MFKQIFQDKDLYLRDGKIIISSNADKAAFGFLLAAAVATLAPISRNLDGFLRALVANFLAALPETLPNFLKKSPRPSA